MAQHGTKHGTRVPMVPYGTHVRTYVRTYSSTSGIAIVGFGRDVPYRGSHSWRYLGVYYVRTRVPTYGNRRVRAYSSS